MAAASIWWRLADQCDAAARSENSREAAITEQEENAMAEVSNALSARRQRNFEAMRSPASIALGIAAIVLVTLVSVFYDHPVLETPQIISTWHSQAASTPL
jgi:hypothetical protein